jgi:hypothetical protein
MYTTPITDGSMFTKFIILTGKLTKFFQALQVAWVGVRLGLGTVSLGLEHDFFHSLML